MRVLITGGAGYIGSALVAALLSAGDDVIVVDNLLFGGESILPFWSFERFRLVKHDVCAAGSFVDLFADVDAVVHLAAVVGFPACDKAGKEDVWRVNVESTERLYQAAVEAGVDRFVFSSSYSNYGETSNGKPVTEDSPLQPKSLYAESKIAAEKFLLSQSVQSATAPVCLRLATVFGLSPRTRFDLMVNQFVLEAYLTGRIVVFQENFRRSFVSVRDVVRAIGAVLRAPIEKVRSQVFNVGSERLNLSKNQIVELIRAEVPHLKVEFIDKSFAGDIRDIHMSCAKIRSTLGFEAVEDAALVIRHMLWILQNEVISQPSSSKFRNHEPILL